jgi:hypothetical protein
MVTLCFTAAPVPVQAVPLPASYQVAPLGSLTVTEVAPAWWVGG